MWRRGAVCLGATGEAGGAEGEDRPRENRVPSADVRERAYRRGLIDWGRRVVLVSRDVLAPVPVVPSPDGRIYEVRNIAVNPSTPSVAARVAASISVVE